MRFLNLLKFSTEVKIPVLGLTNTWPPQKPIGQVQRVRIFFRELNSPNANIISRLIAAVSSHYPIPTCLELTEQ